MSLFSRRVHESIAFASTLAASFALHVAWMTNVLVYRSAFVAQWLTLSVRIGPVSGLYVMTMCSFGVIFIVTLFLSRGRDLSHWREGVYWFFLASVLLFLIMSMPAIYQIGVVIE